MTSRIEVGGAAAFALSLSLALGACADFERGPAAPVPEAGVEEDASAPASDGAALSFAADVRPILEACTRCHAPGQEAARTNLVFSGNPSADYMAVTRFVDTTAPTSSRLLAKMRGQGHEGGTIYASGSPEYQTVLQCIQQGARP